MGSLRAMLAEPVRRKRKSDSTPPPTTPAVAAMKGRMAKNPIRSHAMWRSVAR